jgi:hypothetical protein
VAADTCSASKHYWPLTASGKNPHCLLGHWDSIVGMGEDVAGTAVEEVHEGLFVGAMGTVDDQSVPAAGDIEAGVATILDLVVLSVLDDIHLTSRLRSAYYQAQDIRSVVVLGAAAVAYSAFHLVPP